tara:strand:- start:498 stop:1112 length:615 start_codon:yes stop_codon:yes gene_type:complete
MYKYPVIIFEGIEASGKSTNIKIVANYLKKIKRKFIKLREPGGTKNSEKIRKLILNNKSNLSNKTDLLLLLAGRSENIDKIISKNYKKKIILIDRFTDSTIAYQHYGMKINLNIIRKLNNFVKGDFYPSLTFLSIVNKTNMQKRLKARSKVNKYDKFQYNFYDKVQKGFLNISKNKKNYVTLNSNTNSITEIKSILINNINKLI